MAALDAKIDRLYQLALDAFTAERNTLARSLTGAEATLVKKLPKPTAIPWAVNRLQPDPRREQELKRQADITSAEKVSRALKSRRNPSPPS